jgi:hypothetical protein
VSTKAEAIAIPIPVTLLDKSYGVLHDIACEIVEEKSLLNAGELHQHDELANQLAYCNTVASRIRTVCKAHVGLVDAVNRLLQIMDDARNDGVQLTDEEEETRQFALSQLAGLEKPSQDEQQRLSAGLHAASDYLNDDRTFHKNRWRIDAGKLQTALEQSGLRVMPI